MSLSPINDRIFYACQAVYVGSSYSTSTGTPYSASYIEGIQSIGVSKEIVRETYDDIGRFQKEYGSYGKTVFTINISRIVEKAGDFFYNVNGQTTYENAHILSDNGIGYSGIQDKLKNYDIILVYTQDSKDYVNSGAGGDANPGSASAVAYRRCLLTNITYSIPTQGPVIENLTFTTHYYDKLSENVLESYPAKVVDQGESIRRADVLTSSCVFPVEVTRMFDLSTSSGGIPILGIQQIDIECNINYQDLVDIGMWRGSAKSASQTDTGLDETLGAFGEINKFKVVELPVEVSCTFQGVLRDQYQLTSNARNSSTGKAHSVTDVFHTAADGDDTPTDHVDIYKADREIKIIAEADGSNLFQWHLGAKNYLTSLDVSGGDTGGGNVEGTVSFQNDHSEIFLLKDSTIRNFSTSSIY
jgi:hypothetical protein